MDGEIVISVLQRGWVMVGRRSSDGVRCVLRSASIIRRWGTTKGLGELYDGPTPSTILEPCKGPYRYHELQEIFTQDVSQDVWSKYCPQSAPAPSA